MVEMSGYQVYQALRVNAKGTRTMDAAAQSARTLRENWEDRVGELRKIERDLAEAWKGGAAEQAMRAAKPMLSSFDDTITELGKHESALAEQSAKSDLPAAYVKPDDPTSTVDATAAPSTGAILGGGTAPPEVGGGGGDAGGAGSGGYGPPGTVFGHSGGGAYVAPHGASAGSSPAGSARGAAAGPSDVPGYSGAPNPGNTSSQGYAPTTGPGQRELWRGWVRLAV
jgi:hypothetical protein